MLPRNGYWFARSAARSAALFFFAAGLYACMPQLHPYALPPVRDSSTRNELARHAVFVDNDGRGIEPRVRRLGKTFEDSVSYAQYVSGIMTGIRSHRDSGYPDVLVRIHGGLNSFRESLSTVIEMDSAIKADSAKKIYKRDTISKIYPLFINWESGIVESYGDHLMFVRQGRRMPFDLWTAMEAPFYLVADFGRAASRLPIVWWGQVRRTNSCANTQDVAARPDTSKNRRFRVRTPPGEYAELHRCGVMGAFEDQLFAFDDSLRNQWDSGAKVEGEDRVPVVSRFGYHRTTGAAWKYYLTAPPTSLVPVRTWWALGSRALKHHTGLTAPILPRKHRSGPKKIEADLINALSVLPVKVLGLLFLDAIGTPAWDNMRRRTKTMFVQPYSAAALDAGTPSLPKPGAVAILFDSLRALQTSVSGKKALPLRITLVGHSMGAIIANEALRTNDSLEVKYVVFMAGAISLREFQMGALPYLERHPASEFFNLSLHPLSENRESAFHGVAPYGSLLAWLDSYLASPEAELDRVMGKYLNTTEASAIITGDAKRRFHLKAFGYGDGTGCGQSGLPFAHGDFNSPEVPYWNPQFWAPGRICPSLAHVVDSTVVAGARINTR